MYGYGCARARAGTGADAGAGTGAGAGTRTRTRTNKYRTVQYNAAPHLAKCEVALHIITVHYPSVADHSNLSAPCPSCRRQIFLSSAWDPFET